MIAAKTFTSKQDIFGEFGKLRNEAAFEATGLAAAVTLTHFSSAFTLVTTSQAVPLASWGLADAVVFLTGCGAPLVYLCGMASCDCSVGVLGVFWHEGISEPKAQETHRRSK